MFVVRGHFTLVAVVIYVNARGQRLAKHLKFMTQSRSGDPLEAPTQG